MYRNRDVSLGVVSSLKSESDMATSSRPLPPPPPPVSSAPVSSLLCLPQDGKETGKRNEDAK